MAVRAVCWAGIRISLADAARITRADRAAIVAGAVSVAGFVVTALAPLDTPRADVVRGVVHLVIHSTASLWATVCPTPGYGW
jgi:hypothetical protein